MNMAGVEISDILQILPLAHGLLTAINDHGLGLVDDTVADGISQLRVGQFLRLVRNVKLGTEDREISRVPRLHEYSLNDHL